MCGIYGLIHSERLNVESIDRRLTRFLGHRGPDAINSVTHEGAYFFHSRLAIQDIACGQQPMYAEHHLIVFNGEIYNHQDLREEYRLDCSTNSDTETILKLYARVGNETFGLLDGMFALGLYDLRSGRLVLARDRSGEKPLYYHCGMKTGSFSFSSELNALYVGCPEELVVDEEELLTYLQQGFFVPGTSVYEKVTEVIPGTFVTVDSATAQPVPEVYWDPAEAYRNGARNRIDSEEEALEVLDEVLSRSVKQQLLSSDIEVGTFLSGGIDSGLVTALATKFNKNIRSFTVAFSGEYDESELARQSADYLGTIHRELHIDFGDLKDRVLDIFGAYGQPFSDDSAIPSWFVTQAAKEHLSVVLTGDGADEQFGGYRRYVPQRYLDPYTKSSSVFSRGLRSLIAPKSHGSRGARKFLHRLLGAWNEKNLSGTYLTLTTDAFYSYRDRCLKEIPPLGVLEERLRLGQSMEELAPLDRALFYDFSIMLPAMLLPKMDIAAMQNALETRAPFLGKEILELATRLHPNLKIRGVTTKYLLRELSKRYLPASIIGQPKRGFEIPIHDWLSHTLAPVWKDMALSTNSQSRRLLRPEYLNQLTRTDHGLPEDHWSKQAMTILGLEAWEYRRRQLGEARREAPIFHS
ncbi:asparagine synthase (glutamine-hydrolyzing) [Lewinella sp. IMCC34191]|uniref:asparagine synthase (glutamine-hydrolyzing) n=1 Tax=Lewinella sp. IMCC34191 TaxID=2259172 RepID=UPI000E226590|nr:asparagine synthase (glutamine-hydrolyzing) [Lewinella sp. IMCC34191]